MKKGILGLAAAIAFLAVEAGPVQLELNLTGLESMKGQHYEGWNIISGKPYSTGRFSLKKDGTVYKVSKEGDVIKKIGEKGTAKFHLKKNHRQSTLFVLTIEPNGDTDSGPSQVHIMGGRYKNGKANLAVEHNSSLGTNFESASGSFILAAPTGGEANQGVWFVDPQKGKASLELPSLPQGWAYEGWIVNTRNQAKFSTGVFREVAKGDSDNAGLFAGPLKLDFPPVPGQDIVKTPVVLDDGIHAIVVTVEPYPDFDPAPYSIKILKQDVLKNSPGMMSISMENISQSLPQGFAHLH